MKKFITLLLVLALALCLGVAAFAEEAELDGTTDNSDNWYQLYVVSAKEASTVHGGTADFSVKFYRITGPDPILNERTLDEDEVTTTFKVIDMPAGADGSEISGSTYLQHGVQLSVADDAPAGEYKIKIRCSYSNYGGLIEGWAEEIVTVEVGHSELEWQEYLDPTCSEAGHLEYWQCPECGDCFEDAEGTAPIEDLDAWMAEGGNGYIPPLNHEFDGESQLEKISVEPTCTEDGCKEFWHCLLCDMCYEDEECTKLIGNLEEDLEAWILDPDGGLIPALGHDWGDWTDCEDGYFHHTRACNRCGATETEEHNWGPGEDIGGGKTKWVCDDCGCTLIEGGKAAPEKPQAPKTGDESNFVLWAVSALALGSAAVVVLKKKEN